MNTNPLFEAADFLNKVVYTLEYRRRRNEYERYVSELAEGEVLAAYCERFGMEPITVEVNDFYEYNNTLDLLENRFSPVYSLEWFNKVKQPEKKKALKRRRR